MNEVERQVWSAAYGAALVTRRGGSPVEVAAEAVLNLRVWKKESKRRDSAAFRGLTPQAKTMFREVVGR